MEFFIIFFYFYFVLRSAPVYARPTAVASGHPRYDVRGPILSFSNEKRQRERATEYVYRFVYTSVVRVFLFAGGSPHTRRQRVRHDRQTRPSGRANRTLPESDFRRRPRMQANVFVPDERIQERPQANAIRRSEGNNKHTSSLETHCFTRAYINKLFARVYVRFALSYKLFRF